MITLRQVYAELGKIAGHGCSGVRFVEARKVNAIDLDIIQSRLMGLLEKISQDRAYRDFHRSYREPRHNNEARASRRRALRATRATLHDQLFEANMRSRPSLVRHNDSPSWGRATLQRDAQRASQGQVDYSIAASLQTSSEGIQQLPESITYIDEPSDARWSTFRLDNEPSPLGAGILEDEI